MRPSDEDEGEEDAARARGDKRVRFGDGIEGLDLSSLEMHVWVTPMLMEVAEDSAVTSKEERESPRDVSSGGTMTSSEPACSAILDVIHSNKTDQQRHITHLGTALDLCESNLCRSIECAHVTLCVFRNLFLVNVSE